MVISFIIFLTILCMKINGEPLYPSHFEKRFNALEYELIQTKDDLRETKDRLSIMELQNQEQQIKNYELELKFKNVVTTLNSNNLELNDKLKITESEVAHAIDKLKAVEAELIYTKAELKLTNSHLSVVETELKATNARVNTISSQCATTATKQKEHLTTSDKKTISEFNDAVANETNNNERLFSKLNSQKPKSNLIKSNKAKRVDELPLGSIVAFHAEMGPDASSLTPDQTIKFQRVKQNFGNGYDPKIGIFTSPKYGLYFFTFTILSNPNKRVDTKLVVNGSPIAYSLSAGIAYNSGSRSVIVPLHPGDRVWLEFSGNSGNDNNIVGSYGSTLTGFIISAN